MAKAQLNFGELSGGGLQSATWNISIARTATIPYRVLAIPASICKSVTVTKTASANANLYVAIYRDMTIANVVTTKNTTVVNTPITMSQSDIESALASYPNAYILVSPDGDVDTVKGTITVEFKAQ